MKSARRSCCFAVAAITAAVTPPAAAVTWSAPRAVDNPPRGMGVTMAGITCLSAHVCIAYDSDGEIVVSRHPARGQRAWRFVQPAGGGVNGLSCPSASLCFGYDPFTTRLVWSSNPLGPPSAWKRAAPIEPSAAQVNAPYVLTGMACPSARLCVAVDSFGDALTSQAPTRGTTPWTLTKVAATKLTGIACPSVSLCVAVGENGTIVVSRDPAGGTSAWSARQVDGTSALNAISCPDVGFCVGVDEDGRAVVSTAPLRGAWTVRQIDTQELSDVSCRSRDWCAVTEFSSSTSRILISRHPTRGRSAWSRAKIPSSFDLRAVACPSATLCVAVDGAGEAITSVHPGTRRASWSAVTVDGIGIQLDAVSCPSATLCVAADARGNVLTSGSPANVDVGWRAAAVDRRAALLGISCPTVTLCVAVDNRGDVVSSTAPTMGAHTWKLALIAPGHHLTGVSCPGPSLCVAVGDGIVASSPDPARNAHWTVSAIDSGRSLTAVSCPSPTLCVAGDAAGNAVTSMSPRRSSSWRVEPADPPIPCYVSDTGDGGSLCFPCVGTFCSACQLPECSSLSSIVPAIAAISCPTTSLCVAVDNDGNVITSLDPSTATAGWTVANVEPLGLCTPSSFCDNTLHAVACQSSGLCVAGDGNGDTLGSTDPTGGGGAWHLTAPGISALNGFTIDGGSCAPVSFCVVVNQYGDVIVGR